MTDVKYQELDWLWWDFCEEPPLGKYYQGVENTFSEKWRQIRVLLEKNCCLCKETPKYTGRTKIYHKEYAWPLTFTDTQNLAHAEQLNTGEYMYINPQTSKRLYPKAISKWKVHTDGTTHTLQCLPGYSMNTPTSCELCNIESYSSNENGNSVCMKCPENMQTEAGKSIDDCACKKGYTKSHATGTCLACPINTYKDVIGDSECLSCPLKKFSRAASICPKQCSELFLPGLNTGIVFLHENILGLLSQNHDMPTERRCIYSEDRKEISCPGKIYTISHNKPTDNTCHPIQQLHYPLHPINSQFDYHSNIYTENYRCDGGKYTNNNVKDILFMVSMGHIGPGISGLSTQIYIGMAWQKQTKIVSNILIKIPHTKLYIQEQKPHSVYIINMLVSKELETSKTTTDWDWLVCGRHSTGGEILYSQCENEMDHDNTNFMNKKRDYLLDLQVIKVNTGENEIDCSSEHLDVCSEHKAGHRIYNINTVWSPNVKNIQTKYWLYTFFMYGESEACLKHNCNEEFVYDIKDKYDYDDSFENKVILLPGTELYYSSASLIEQNNVRNVPIIHDTEQHTHARKKWYFPKIPHRANIRHTQIKTVSSPSRALLQTTDSAPDAGNGNAGYSIENTALSNDDNVVNAVCPDAQHITCLMFRIDVDLEDILYCHHETIIISHLETKINNFLKKSSSHKLQGLQITSIARDKYTDKCGLRPGNARRLLATTRVIATTVAFYQTLDKQISSGSKLEIYETDDDKLKSGIRSISTNEADVDIVDCNFSDRPECLDTQNELDVNWDGLAAAILWTSLIIFLITFGSMCCCYIFKCCCFKRKSNPQDQYQPVPENHATIGNMDPKFQYPPPRGAASYPPPRTSRASYAPQRNIPASYPQQLLHPASRRQ